MASPNKSDLEKDGCSVQERVDGYKTVVTPDGTAHVVQEYSHVPGYSSDTKNS